MSKRPGVCIFVTAMVATSLLLITDAGGALMTLAKEWTSDIHWAEPPVVTPGENGSPPSDAIILFDGSDLSQWAGGEKWTIENGYGICQGDLRSKRKFGDCQLHLEFATPEEVTGSGQGRGNSGLHLMGRYEVQILDSFGNETYFDGQCGAIYKQHPPLVNASRQPGEWQTYDIIFTAPRFHADGSLKSRGVVTLLHNGVLVQDHFELQGTTSYVEPPIYHAHAEREPLTIQFHRNPVKFRNIWLRDLMPSESSQQPQPEAAGDAAATISGEAPTQGAAEAPSGVSPDDHAPAGDAPGDAAPADDGSPR